MFLSPRRLMSAGTQRPASTSMIDQILVWPLLMKTSTYSTQPTAMAALPAQAVIQYDHAFANRSLLPNAPRAQAYGPPSAGMRRANDANSLARSRAPIVVRPSETSVIGPYGASDDGRLKIPTPTMLPTTSAVAPVRPRRSAARPAGDGASARARALTSSSGKTLAGPPSTREPDEGDRTGDVGGDANRNDTTVRLLLSMSCSSASVDRRRRRRWARPGGRGRRRPRGSARRRAVSLA